MLDDSKRIINNNNNDDQDIIPPNFPPPPIKSMLRRNSSLNQHQFNANTAINQNPSIQPSDFTRTKLLLTPNKPDLFNFAQSSTMIEEIKGFPSTIDDTRKQQQLNGPSKNLIHFDNNSSNENNCQSKLAYPVLFCDDHQVFDKEISYYLCQHEPITQLPKYDNIASQHMDKYIECDGQIYPQSHCNIPISKFHASTCNLSNHFNPSNLINGHNFSNSLNNFNISDPHQRVQNYYNFNPSFTQMSESMRRNGVGMPSAFGSSSINGSSFASNISLNGTPKQQANMPWKHRNCSSRSSSSGTNSSSKFHDELCKLLLL